MWMAGFVFFNMLFWTHLKTSVFECTNFLKTKRDCFLKKDWGKKDIKNILITAKPV